MDKGKRPMEETAPSEASSSEEVEAPPTAGASSRAQALPSPGNNLTENPPSPPAITNSARDPLEDFEVPPAGAPFGAGSPAPSGGFPWMPELGPMLDELWSEETFRQLSEEPLQAGNREGMRLFAKVCPFSVCIPFCFVLLLILTVAGIPGELHLLPEVGGNLRPGTGCSTPGSRREGEAQGPGPRTFG